jgi:hypothetical protein
MAFNTFNDERLNIMPHLTMVFKTDPMRQKRKMDAMLP